MPLQYPLNLFAPSYVDTGTLQSGSYDVEAAQNHVRQLVDNHYKELGSHRSIIDRGSDEYREALPHHLTFSAVWNWHLKYYYTYYDESQIDSIQNSLAMRRDGFVQELLWHRQMPVASLPFSLEVTDPDDAGQVKIRKEFQRVLDDIPYFQRLKIQLLESIYYGKSGSQILWDKKKIGAREFTTISGHQPVNGDKIAYDWDGTPGVFIYKGSDQFNNPDLQKYIKNLDRGPAFFLRDRWYRDHFVIHEFQPTDTDYLFESEKAAAVHGLGFRDRFYFTWKMRSQVLTWYLNAIERVGANGMLYAYYPTGNAQARNAVFQALKDLISSNVAAFPRSPGDANSMIERLDPSQVGYDVMYQLLLHLEGIMRRGLLGQNLSSQSEATGLGSGVADFQGESREAIILYDATCLAETLDEQIVSKILNNNTWEYEGKWYRGSDLPFSVRLKLQVNRQSVQELIQSAQVLWSMGVPLDMDDLRDKATLKAPRSKASTLVNKQLEMAEQGGGQPGKPGQNGKPMNGKPSGNGSSINKAVASDTASEKPEKERFAFQDDTIQHRSYMDTPNLRKQDLGQNYGTKFERLRFELANFDRTCLRGAFYDPERERAWISIFLHTPYKTKNDLINSLIAILGAEKFRVECEREPSGARWITVNLTDFDSEWPEFYGMTAEEIDAEAENVEDPSEAQKKAGNYRKAHVNVQGLPITIETPRGRTRSGVNKDGKSWSTKMEHHYGYIKKTESEADGDHIDVFVGRNPESESVYIVNQTKPDGEFDEHKCMIGFHTKDEAKQGYLDCYSPGWKGLGSIQHLTIDQFKEWLHKGDSLDAVESLELFEAAAPSLLGNHAPEKS